MRKVGSIGDETRRQIRRYAVELIAKHGYEAMNLRQLAASVGIKVGSLYNHIGSKQDLLTGLLREVMEDLLNSLEKQVLNLDGPLQQFQAFVQLHIQFHVDRKNDVMIASTELRSLNTRNWKSIVRLRNQYEAAVAGILKKGCAEGVFKIEDVKLATLALIPMLTGVSQWYRVGGKLTRKELLQRYTNLALTMVGAVSLDATALQTTLLPASELMLGRLPDFNVRPR